MSNSMATRQQHMPADAAAEQTVASNPAPSLNLTNSSGAPNQRKFKAGEVYPIIDGKLYFCAHWNDEHTLLEIQRHPWRFYFSSDFQENYQPFCSDFGPVNLASVTGFVARIQEIMLEPRLEGRPLVYYCSMEKDHLTNLAFLFGCYLVLEEGMSVERAGAPFQDFSQESDPFLPYRDATYVPSTYDLHLKDCLLGLQKAASLGWYDLGAFDTEVYEYLDDPRNADMHVIANKFVAFKGPRDDQSQAYTFTPQHYVPLFKELEVEAVIRLNEPSTYDASQFTKAGIAHYDLEFPDCTTPPLHVCRKFLQIVKDHEGKVAVHCLAGLGRTGTLIAIWLMSNHGFTADEAMGYLRITRPGSVIGPQQQFLKHLDKADILRRVGLMEEGSSDQDFWHQSVQNVDHSHSAKLAAQICSAVTERGEGRQS